MSSTMVIGQKQTMNIEEGNRCSIIEIGENDD
jgi:hypothetical protein